MRRTRPILLIASALLALLLFAPAALAHTGDGEGWYGETSDSAITTVMFATIAFFPVIIIAFSLIQWRLEKRKHERLAAAKRRAASVDWRGGW
jgi:hypothetical protein